MSQNSGTKVIAPIVTPSTLDTFPTHMANTGKGGHHSVATIVERDSIPPDRRLEGMLCAVIDEEIVYQLIGGIENASWKVFTAGGNGATDASGITYTPSGELESVNVQLALDELEAEKASITDVYTKDEVDTLFNDLEVDYNELLNPPDLSSLHEHADMETLEKFAVTDGKLTWDGKEIGSTVDSTSINISDVPYDIGDVDSKSLKEILDELMYIAPAITAFGANPSVVEKGTSVNSLVLNWTINKAITEQSINQGIGTLDKALRTHTITSPVTNNVTYTLTINDGKNSVNRNASISFRSKLYWGLSTLDTLTNAEVLTLNSELATSRVKTVSFNPTNQYIYIAMPTSFGTPSFKVNGLANDAWEVTPLSHTNSQNFSENYTIYRSQYVQNGSGINIEIT